MTEWRGPHPRALLLRAGMTAVLVAVVRLTAFSNEIVLDLSPGAVRLSSHANTAEVAVPVAQIDRVTVSLQSSMSGGVRLTSYRATAETGVVQATDFDCFYVFGRCLCGSALFERAPGFTLSFGDWTMDRFVGPPLTVSDIPLAPPMRLSFTFVGRGGRDVSLHLANGRAVKASVHDGFLDNAYALCVDDRCAQHGFSRESVATNLCRIVNWFAEALLLGAVLWWAVTVLSCLVPQRSPSRRTRPPGRSLAAVVAIVCVAVGHFATAYWFSRSVLGSTPHISDSAIYYRQAILLSQGTLRSAPLPAEPAAAFQSNGSRIVDGRLEYAHASHFWPALLGLFVRLGIPDVLGPLLSAITVPMVFLLGRLMFDDVTGLLAALLFAMSPFALIQAGDYMLHTPTLALFLSGVVATAYGARTSRTTLVAVGGALVVSAFGMRQLTVTALGVPLAGYALACARPHVSRRTVLAFVGGAAGPGTLVLLDNRLISGAWLTPPHQHVHGLTVSVAHLASGLNAVDATLGYLPAAVVGSSVPVLVLGLFTFPFFVRVDPRTLLLAGCFVTLTAVHTLVPVSGLHGYGPRFLFEGLFALALLGGYTLSLLLTRSRPALRSVVAVLALVATVQNAYLLETVLPRYERYNGIARETVVALRARTEGPAVFVMRGTSWQAMDVAATLFDPSFTQRIFVRELPAGAQQRVLEAFPAWPVLEVDGSGVRRIDRGAPHGAPVRAAGALVVGSTPGYR